MQLLYAGAKPLPAKLVFCTVEAENQNVLYVAEIQKEIVFGGLGYGSGGKMSCIY